MLLASRIQKLVDECTGGSQAAFAKRIGEAQSTLHGYLNLEGQGKIKAKTLLRILEEFNVDANWLLLGEGEMFRKAVVVREKEDVLEGLNTTNGAVGVGRQCGFASVRSAPLSHPRR